MDTNQVTFYLKMLEKSRKNMQFAAILIHKILKKFFMVYVIYQHFVGKLLISYSFSVYYIVAYIWKYR